MFLRRPTAIAAGVLLLATPVLTSCGFDYATDRVNTISAGVNERNGDVDILGAVVIAGQDDAGVFVATLANNSTSDEAALTAFTGGAAGELQPIEEVATVTVPRSGAVSMFQTGGIPVSGTFKAGNFVDVTLNFSNGQSSTLEVPVVTPCFQYDVAKFPAIELPGTEAADEPAEAAEAAETVAETEGEHEGEHEGGPGPYSCEAAPPVELHGGE
ncbi:MAG: hypothetical protein WB767_13070 [Nocardioides sp.]